MTTPELTKWLRENSSGAYRPAAEAADLINRLIESIDRIEDAAYSAQDWGGTHLGETIDAAKKEAGLFLG